VLLTLLATLVWSGCGGGGSGPTPTTTLSGRVVSATDMSPIPLATIAIVGTMLTAQTQTDGTFTVSNVPVTATHFTVTSPDLTKYLSIAEYSAGGATLQEYSFDINGVPCSLPLPTLRAGTTALPSDIELLSATSVPPLPTTCP
jgi:hypothetical protein